jgi:fatty acid elongase 3
MSYSSSLTPQPFVLAPLKLRDLSPWTNFNKAWSAVMGYPAEEFIFKEGKTPMSTLTETLTMIVLYLVVIFGGREIMRNREPYKLNTLFKIHNFMLTAISGALLVLFAEQLIPTLWRRGLYDNICGESGWTQPLVVLYYVSI